MSDSMKKLVVVGDGTCGKTSILHMFCHGQRAGEYRPTVFDTFAARVVVRNKERCFAIWDTSGQEDWESLRKQTYPDTDLVIIVFDISNPDSLFNAVEIWHEEVLKHCPCTPFLLVGNKTDLRAAGEGRVDPQSGEAVARNMRALSYIECSALTGDGIDDVFHRAAHIMYERSCKCTLI